MSADSVLPLLREDIQLLAGPATPEGRPTWAIFDPVRNRYFRIGWEAFQLLSRWSAGSPERLLEKTRQETTCEVQAEDVSSLLNFLYASNLTQSPAGGDIGEYVEQHDAMRANWFSWLMRNYLFLRLPLVRPDPLLQKLARWTNPLFTAFTRNLLLLLGLLGVFLVSRQWEAFTSTFLYFFSTEGMIFYVLGLAVVKICHEFGHALMATRYGCRVASMGVAFLVFFPVLYTDTTDVYRLTSRKQRLTVSAAGIMTEFYLALVCIFLWSLLPDGVLRSLVFVLGTISFVLTVMVNLNPFLRFDGYYFLSDWLGLENLQERSFALGRWKLRQLLFGMNDPVPEKFQPGMERFLYSFAWATWAYRFFLLTAIAAIVYSYFFKLLGLVLFVGVLYSFLWQPLLKELRDWWERRDQVSGRRGVVLFMAIGMLAALLLIPWRSTISLPAVLMPENRATVYAPAPGRIASVSLSPGQQVEAGDVLLTLISPSLEKDLETTAAEIRLLQYRLQRIAASAEELSNLRVLEQRLQEKRTRLVSLQAMQAQLTLRSPISGKVADVADSLHPGRWINESLAIAHVIDSAVYSVTAILPESELSRIAAQQPANFVPDDASIDSLPAMVVEIDNASLADLDLRYLASVYGGDVAVREDRSGRLVPESAIYRLRLAAARPASEPQGVLRGVAQVEGEPMSFARRAYDIVAAAVTRGATF